MKTPIKFNGPKLDAIILGSHLQMMNYDAIEKTRKRHIVWDNIGILFAIGSMIYMAIR